MAVECIITLIYGEYLLINVTLNKNCIKYYITLKTPFII